MTKNSQKHFYPLIVLFLSVFLFQNLSYSSQGITYQGRILTPSNTPLVSSAVGFYLRVVPSSSACTIYSESTTLDMSSGDGSFNLIIGQGQRVDSGTIPFDKIFDRKLNITPSTDCPSGYVRQPNDSLFLRIAFNDGTGYQNLSPLEITASPFALDSINVAGVDSKNVLRVADAETPPLTASNFTELLALLNGTSNQYLKSSGAPESLSESYLAPIITPGKVSGSAINAGTIGGSTAINTSGAITTSGSLSSSTFATNSVSLFNGAQSLIITAPSLSGNYNLVLPNNDGDAGQILRTDGAGNLSWVTPSAGGGGSVGSVSTTATAGNPIVVNGTPTDPTIDIPPASASNNGYLTSSDWTTFNNKQTAGNYITALTGDVTAAGPGSSAATIATNAVTSTKIADGAVTTTKAITTNPGINRLIATDGTTGTTLSKFDCVTLGHVLSWGTNGFECTSIASLYSAPVTSVAGRTGAVTIASADISDAASTNTASTLVKRDTNGDFSAGTMTSTGLITSALQVTGGTPGIGKVLTSDTSGNATWATAPNSSQWITSGSDIYFNTGLVGIGTAQPGIQTTVGRTYLTIKGSSDAGILELTQGSSDATDNRVGFVQFSDINSTWSEKRVAAIGSTLKGNAPNARGGELQFYTKDNGNWSLNQRMVIDRVGNIGIGTSTPSYKLDVAGSINSTGILRFASGTNVGTVSIDSDGNGGTFNAGINNTGSLSSVVVGRLNTTGTASTAVAIGINNTVTFDNGMAIGKSNSAGANSVAIGKDTVAGDGATSIGNGVNNSVSGTLQIGPSNTAKITINSSGNVGIGTETPSERVDLGGGNISMGYQIVTATCGNVTNCVATCPVGKRVLGGGGDCAGSGIPISVTRPSGNSAWELWLSGSSCTTSTFNVYAICANIR
jgi:hypothetical protein